MPKSKSKLHALTIGGSPDDVEARFYEALHAGDIEKLMACWADDDEIVCIHPGGPRLLGAGAIRASFDTMFANDNNIHATPEQVRRVTGVASAVHHVLEKVEMLSPDGPLLAYVLATNVYHKTAQGWRLVVHHASLGSAGESQEIRQAPHTLH